MAYSSPSARIPDSGAERVSELWEDLNLGELLEGVKRTNDSTASANKVSYCHVDFHLFVFL